MRVIRCCALCCLLLLISTQFEQVHSLQLQREQRQYKREAEQQMHNEYEDMQSVEEVDKSKLRNSPTQEEAEDLQLTSQHNLMQHGNTVQNHKQQQQQREHIPDADVDGDVEDDMNFQYNPQENSFYDHFDDGTYAFGYSLPNGVRRFERSYYSPYTQGMIVEGFYSELRDLGTRKYYEVHCYRSGAHGYRPMKVRYVKRAPMVRRDLSLDVNCFDN